LLRVDDMAYRIIHEVRLSARSREEWVNSVRNNTEGIPAVVTKCVKDGGKFTLLRAIPDKGNPRVVFRVVFATGGGPVIVFVSRGLEYVRPRLSSVVRASDLQTGWQSGSAPPSSP
jgi:hypothetical protein